MEPEARASISSRVRGDESGGEPRMAQAEGLEAIWGIRTGAHEVFRTEGCDHSV